MYNVPICEVTIYNEIWRPGYVTYERTDSGTIDIINVSTGKLVEEIDMTTDDIKETGTSKVSLPVGTYRATYDTLGENNRPVENNIEFGVTAEQARSGEKIEVTLKQEPISAKLNVNIDNFENLSDQDKETLKRVKFEIITPTRTWVDNLNLSDSGTLEVVDLPVGKYEIQAKSDTPGLNWEQRNIPFEVTSKTENLNVNYKVSSEGIVLEILVTDENGKPDYGTFNVNGNIVEVKGGKALLTVPNKTDILITQLPIGNKVGMVNTKRIKIKEGETGLKKLEIKNNIPVYTLNIETLDSITKEVLMGAEYLITSEQGIEYKYVIGDNFVKLPKGKYTIVQTSSPKKGGTNYILQTVETPLTLNKDETIQIVNSQEEIKEVVNLKKGASWITLVITLVVSAGLFMIFKR